MAVETHLYLVPLVEMETRYYAHVDDPEPEPDEVEQSDQYKHLLYEPDGQFDGGPEGAWTWTSWPADDDARVGASWRFVRLTCDGNVHTDIMSDKDIICVL